MGPVGGKLDISSHVRAGKLAAAFLAALLGAALWSNAAGQGCSVRISSIDNDDPQLILRAVLAEAYRRIGCSSSFVNLPAQRAIEWASSGETDGDTARIAGIEERFPNLVRIPTPVFNFVGSAFAAKPGLKIDTPNDLKGLKVGIIRGIRYSEQLAEGLNPVLATDGTHLFRLLLEGRIDAAIAGRIAGLSEINRNFRGSGIYVAGDKLYEAPLYHVINAGIKDLAPRLGEALKKMAESGEIEAITKRVTKEIFLR